MRRPPATSPERHLEDVRGMVDGLSRQRRLGILLMFFFVGVFALLFILMGVLASMTPGGVLGNGGRSSAPPHPILQTAMMIIGLLMLFSVVSFPVGAGIRLLAWLSLRKLERKIDFDALPAWPRLRKGERLGSWVVIAADTNSIQVARRLLPPPARIILKLGLESYLALLLTAVAISTFHQAGPIGGTIAALPFALLWAGVFFGIPRPYRWIGLRSSGGRHVCFPSRRGSARNMGVIDIEDIAEVRVSGPQVALETRNADLYSLFHGPATSIFAWQARRVGHHLGQVLALTEADGDFEESLQPALVDSIRAAQDVWGVTREEAL